MRESVFQRLRSKIPSLLRAFGITSSYLILAVFSLALLGLFFLPPWLFVFPLILFFYLRRKNIRYLLYLPWLLFALLLVWRVSIQPKQDSDWWPELRRLPTVTFSQDELTISQFRDFDWRSDPITERWQTRQYDLSQLSSIDLLIEPLPESPRFAHSMLTFHFKNGEHLCLSIEARKEDGEKYGVIPGALNQFELIYLIGAESDFLNLRMHVRGSKIYRFPLKMSQQHQRQLLERFLHQANELIEKPAFYRSLTHNCTTALTKEADLILMEHEMAPLGFSINTILPGKLPLLLHRRGLLLHPKDQALEYEEFLAEPL